MERVLKATASAHAVNLSGNLRVALADPDDSPRPVEQSACAGPRIQPLSFASLPSALDLLGREFPRQQWRESARLGLSLSLVPKWLSRLPLWAAGVRSCRYWVAVSQKEESTRRLQVRGITGLYQPRKKASIDAWLGWTCVQPADRGRGIGRALLEFALERAKAGGASKLRVYTDADRRAALALYRSLGFQMETKYAANCRVQLRLDLEHN